MEFNMRHVCSTDSFQPRDILDTLDSGRFLILSRVTTTPDYRYEVYEELTPELFQKRVGLWIPSGPMTAHSVADFLVSVFDKYDMTNCYAFETEDGRIIHQHST
jgi:hypothetical protein